MWEREPEYLWVEYPLELAGDPSAKVEAASKAEDPFQIRWQRTRTPTLTQQGQKA
ncbi:MAG: hypothetical protein O6949_12755 [Chloroflexi bacterium]|nr:hypothetical protein [Chloroflexota bacterium]